MKALSPRPTRHHVSLSHEQVVRAARDFLHADEQCLKLACKQDPESVEAYRTWYKERGRAADRLKAVLEDYA